MPSTEDNFIANPSSHSSTRAPLSWFSLPLLAGAGIQLWLNLTIHLPVIFLISGTLLVLYAGVESRRHPIWIIGVLLWGHGAGAILVNVRSSETINAEHLAPREVQLKVKLVRVEFGSDKFGNVAVHARVKETSMHSLNWVGQTVRLTVRAEQGMRWVRGSVHSIQGVMHSLPPTEQRTPWDKWLMRQGVTGRLTHLVVLEEISPAPAWYGWIHRQHHSCLESLVGTVEPPGLASRIFAAMLLGRRSLIDESDRQRFILSGTMHLFAISGLHVGILASLLYLVLGLMRLPTWLITPVGIGLLWVYVELTGAAPSAVRAWMMVSMIWLSKILTRQPLPYPALIAAIAVILIWNPVQTSSPGFQLSYLVVAAILLYGLPLRLACESSFPLTLQQHQQINAWQKLRTNCLLLIRDSMCISISAFLVSSPLIVELFGIYAPGGVVINVLLVSLATMTVAAGVLTVTAGYLNLTWLEFLYQTSGATFIEIMLRIIDWSLLLPGMHWPLVFPPQVSGLALSLLILGSMIWAKELFTTKPLLAISLPFIVHGLLMLLASPNHMPMI